MVAGREAEGKDTGREIEEGKRGKEAGKDTGSDPVWYSNPTIRIRIQES